MPGHAGLRFVPLLRLLILSLALIALLAVHLVLLVTRSAALSLISILVLLLLIFVLLLVAFVGHIKLLKTPYDWAFYEPQGACPDSLRVLLFTDRNDSTRVDHLFRFGQ